MGSRLPCGGMRFKRRGDRFNWRQYEQCVDRCARAALPGDRHRRRTDTGAKGGPAREARRPPYPPGSAARGADRADHGSRGHPGVCHSGIRPMGTRQREGQRWPPDPRGAERPAHAHRGGPGTRRPRAGSGGPAHHRHADDAALSACRLPRRHQRRSRRADRADGQRHGGRRECDRRRTRCRDHGGRRHVAGVVHHTCRSGLPRDVGRAAQLR